MGITLNDVDARMANGFFPVVLPQCLLIFSYERHNQSSRKRSADNVLNCSMHPESPVSTLMLFYMTVLLPEYCQSPANEINNLYREIRINFPTVNVLIFRWNFIHKTLSVFFCQLLYNNLENQQSFSIQRFLFFIVTA